MTEREAWAEYISGPEWTGKPTDIWRKATEFACEQCAKTCIDEANKQWAAFDAEKTDYLEGRADSADYLAQKMRSNV